jgi:hypothetical protein
MKQMNQRDAMHYIANRDEFQASALSGQYKSWTPEGAWLNSEDYAKLQEATKDRPELVYVVYSYRTPIAWHTDAEGWYVVSQKFSPTTSKHQGYVRRAIAESLQGAN